MAKNITCFSSAQEVLKFASVKTFTDAKCDNSTGQWSFPKEMFFELFQDIKFYLNQFMNKDRISELTGEGQFSKIDGKLSQLLKTFETRLYQQEEFKQLLDRYLNDAVPGNIRTAAFIYASVCVDDVNSSFLNQVITVLCAFPENKKLPVKEALQFALHPAVDAQLKLTATLMGGTISKIIEEIIAFRKVD